MAGFRPAVNAGLSMGRVKTRQAHDHGLISQNQQSPLMAVQFPTIKEPHIHQTHWKSKPGYSSELFVVALYQNIVFNFMAHKSEFYF